MDPQADEFDDATIPLARVHDETTPLARVQDETMPIAAIDYERIPDPAGHEEVAAFPLPVEDPIGSPAPGSPRRSGLALVRGGGWNAGAQLAPLAVNLVMTPYVIHGLGVERF